MRVVDTIEYKDFRTTVKITKEVEKFLLKNHIDLKLSSRIPSAEYWYENLLFEHFRGKTQDNFELVYCGIIEKPEEYESLESIQERLKLEKDNVIFDGSTTLLEIKPTLVRWVVMHV